MKNAISNKNQILNNKTALITGASSGFGKSLAHLLIYEGYTVIGIARREEKLKMIKNHLGDHFHYFKCDVTKPKQILEVTEKLKEENLYPNLFFLNAGQLEYEEIGKINIKKYRNTFEVNYFGAITFIEHWLPYCLKNGGTFIGISSLAAKQPIPNITAYCSSKAALANVFESLRLEYLNSKVKFITVFPGPMKTEMIRSDKNVLFITKPVDAAQYVLKKVLKGKQIISFPFFYKILTNLSTLAPLKLLKKILDFYPQTFQK